MKTNSDHSKEKYLNQTEESVHLGKRFMYMEGINLLRKKERISHFVSLIISLVLVVLMFVILKLA